MHDDELTAFLDALDQTPPDAPTRCARWSAHDLLAHMVAGTEEMARLAELAAAGRTDEPTRPFAGREAPWQLPDPELRIAFFEVGGRFLAALDLPAGQLVPFTGWAMSVEQLRTRAASSCCTGDLVGDDDISARLLDGRSDRPAVRCSPPCRRSPKARAPRADDDLLSLWGRVRR
ncbi:MAG: maleylpyruvate isomerase N-terminal domain-containing protein [Acidimicrobiales bacterium]